MQSSPVSERGEEEERNERDAEMKTPRVATLAKPAQPRSHVTLTCVGLHTFVFFGFLSALPGNDEGEWWNLSVTVRLVQ